MIQEQNVVYAFLDRLSKVNNDSFVKLCSLADSHHRFVLLLNIFCCMFKNKRVFNYLFFLSLYLFVDSTQYAKINSCSAAGL